MADWPYNTARWQRLRRAHLGMEPLCRACQAEGRMRAGSHVDHIRPVSDGGPAFPMHDGLQTLCASCHSAKTARGAEAGAIRSSKPRKGCRADGSPLDPSHPWGETRGKSLPAGRERAAVGITNQLVSKGN